MRRDSNWVVTGFDNALDAKRKVDAFLAADPSPALERLGVTFGQGPSVFIIFDSLLTWRHAATRPKAGPASGPASGPGAGPGAGPAADSTVDQVTAAIVAAFPGREVYYTHDHVGFELVAGDATVAGAVAAGEAERVA